ARHRPWARRRAAASVVLPAGLVAAPPAAPLPVPDPPPPGLVKILAFVYRAHNGAERLAFLALPRWYGPRHDPPIPLVISPHGRGIGASQNILLWGNLPARGRFALISPEGQGRRLVLFSWGDPGQIADLARMPRLARHAFPWLRFERRRIYAVGESMGGQETLLLVAHHPRLLAGAAAFDAPANMDLRYRDFRELRHGPPPQRMARFEIGGPPWPRPRLHADPGPPA